MYFDSLTIAAVAAELRETVLGGRVQHLALTGPLGVSLELYQHHRRHYLMLSAHPRLARAHLSAAKPSRGVAGVTPLLLLLRKYVLRGHLIGIEQPDLERVLILSIAKRPPERNRAEPIDADEEVDRDVRTELIIEIMEQRSNIMLVGDDNAVLAAARIVTPVMSRRPIQPREPYELPPAQDKRDPRNATAAGVRDALTGLSSGGDLARALVGAYRGLSPLAAREVVFRSCGSAAPPPDAELPWEALAHELRRLWQEPAQPSEAIDGAGQRVYAPYLLTHLRDATAAPSISAVLERFYDAREHVTAHAQRRSALMQQLRDVRERYERQRAALLGELERARALDRLRWEGEMIYAFMHELSPGARALLVEGQTIAISPAGPVASALARFKAYDKAKGAMAGVPERLRVTEATIAGIEETATLLDLAEGYEQIESIGREAAAAGWIGGAPAAGRAARPLPPLQVVSSDGMTIYIGRSAGQNEQVTFKLGAPDDLWLHVRGIPGAHVIIKTRGREVPERTLREAAAYAAYYSAARHEAGADVIVARRQLVRRVPGGPLGLVTHRSDENIRVVPARPTLL